MIEIKKTLLRYSDWILLICAMLLANLLFFHQEGWKMEPVKIGAVSMGIYLCMRWLGKRKEQWREKNVLIGSGIFGLLFALMILAGDKIHAGDWEFQAFSAADVLWFCLYGVLGSLLFLSLYLFYTEGNSKGEAKITEQKESRRCRTRRWLGYSFIMILFWIPVLIIYFPGIVPEDATVSIAMVLGDLPWDNHFPVFYSLIAGGCVYIGRLLGNPNLGVFFYSVLQMVSMALILGYVLEWLQRRMHKMLVWFSLAFFCGAPVFGNYAIVMWKDPWYSGLLLLLSLFLYDRAVVEKEALPEKRNLFQYGLLCLLICLMRNNGIYIVILISACLVVYYRKQVKKVALTCAVTILLTYVITGPVYQAVFSAENLFVEAVGVPLQQMVRVVVQKGEMTDEDREFLDHLMPMEKYQEYYNPFLVDPVKWAPEFQTEYLDAHKAEFFKTWFSLLKRNFGTYVEQYLMETYGFWHIGGDTSYEFVKGQIAANDWWLYQYMPFEKYLGYSMQEEIWEKYDFLPSGLLVWIVFFDVMFCWVRKKGRYILPLLAMIGNWLTLMVATPTAFGLRYILVMMLGLPLLVMYPWLVEKGKNQMKCSS